MNLKVEIKSLGDNSELVVAVSGEVRTSGYSQVQGEVKKPEGATTYYPDIAKIQRNAKLEVLKKFALLSDSHRKPSQTYQDDVVKCTDLNNLINQLRKEIEGCHDKG